LGLGLRIKILFVCWGYTNTRRVLPRVGEMIKYESLFFSLLRRSFVVPLVFACVWW
jgi:hypothetical protein